MFKLRRPKPSSPEPSAPNDDWAPGILRCAASDREWQVTLWPGIGQADGGVVWHVETRGIPFALRIPNARIEARRDSGRIVEVRPLRA